MWTNGFESCHAELLLLPITSITLSTVWLTLAALVPLPINPNPGFPPSGDFFGGVPLAADLGRAKTPSITNSAKFNRLSPHLQSVLPLQRSFPDEPEV